MFYMSQTSRVVTTTTTTTTAIANNDWTALFTQFGQRSSMAHVGKLSNILLTLAFPKDTVALLVK